MKRITPIEIIRRRFASADFPESAPDTAPEPRAEATPEPAKHLPDHIAALIAQRGRAAASAFRPIPLAGQIVRVPPCADEKGNVYAEYLAVLLDKEIAVGKWRGWLIGRDADYASEWDLVLGPEEEPRDPLCQIVQVWNPLTLNIQEADKVLAELPAARLAAARSMAQDYRRKVLPEPISDHRCGVHLARLLSDGTGVVTGTPLAPQGDPRNEYMGLYEEIATKLSERPITDERESANKPDEYALLRSIIGKALEIEKWGSVFIGAKGNQMQEYINAKYQDGVNYRLASEALPIFREFGIDGAMAHPFFLHQTTQEVLPIWINTVKISTGSAHGSGFIISAKDIDDGFEDVIITNAHVINRDSSATYEWAHGPFIKRGTGKLLAIDYVHDIAVIELEDGHIPFEGESALRLGECAVPGQEVYLCGFPRGCDLPRISTGLISGFSLVDLYGATNTVLVVQAPANQGSSGGPVCDKDGFVVGVLFAINRRLDVAVPRPKGKVAKELADWLDAALLPIDGYGYALDIGTIKQMLNSIAVTKSYGKHHQGDPFSEMDMPFDEFVDLQRQVAGIASKPDKTSCIGVFNFSDDHELLIGWYNKEQVQLRIGDGLRNILLSYIPSGGHFYLRGHDIVIYKRKTKYRAGLWVRKIKLNLV